MPVNNRVAQPGDIFILLEPAAQDLHRLQLEQEDLKNKYGGQTVDYIHITCQRFTTPPGQSPQLCSAKIQKLIKGIDPFDILTDGLITFYAPYWQNRVLRWRISDSDSWISFQTRIERILKIIKCPSHFTRKRRGSCSALVLNKKLILQEKISHYDSPVHLFTARYLIISRLNSRRQFDIINRIYLR
jgi:hypothetical protein